MRLIQTAIILCTLLCFLVDAATIPTEHRKRVDGGRRRRPGFKKGKKKEGLPKYFHEPGGSELGNHYDSRFEHGIQDYADKKDTQLHMLRAYLTFFNENHMETWLAHGTLLGWWWNGKVPTLLLLPSTCFLVLDRGLHLLTLALLDAALGLGY